MQFEPENIYKTLEVSPMPCPHCGNDEKFRIARGEDGTEVFYCVICGVCGSTGPSTKSVLRAKLAWNNRFTFAQKNDLTSWN